MRDYNNPHIRKSLHQRFHKSFRRPYHPRFNSHRHYKNRRIPEAHYRVKKYVKPQVRGIEADVGMRSWNDQCVNPAITTEAVTEDQSARVNERWIGNEIVDCDSFYSKQARQSSNWQHDKFEKVLEDYNNDQRIKEMREVRYKLIAERRKKKKRDEPRWEHDMFESVLRSCDPDYRYYIRRSPPVHHYGQG